MSANNTNNNSRLLKMKCLCTFAKSQQIRGFISSRSSALSSSFLWRMTMSTVFLVSFKYSFHWTLGCFFSEQVSKRMREIKRHFPTVVFYLSLRRQHSREKSLKYKCRTLRKYSFLSIGPKKKWLLIDYVGFVFCWMLHQKYPFTFTFPFSLTWIEHIQRYFHFLFSYFRWNRQKECAY